MALMHSSFVPISRRFATFAYKETAAYKKRKLIDKVLRVSHAGELGADRIYDGQLCVLSSTKEGPIIKEMWEQEKEHLRTFEELIVKFKMRPSILSSLWRVAGYSLGFGSALLGAPSAMACTVAVETVIADHYNNQIRELMAEPATVSTEELLNTLKKFRDDEQHHHDVGLEHEAMKAPFYKYFVQIIKTGCVGAIWVAEKV